MTEKSQDQTKAEQLQAIELDDERLEEVQGGPIYVKADGVADPVKGIRDGTSN